MKRLGNIVFLALLFSASIFIGIIYQQNLSQDGEVLGELVSPKTTVSKQGDLLPKVTVVDKKSLSFVVGGDVMFDRYIRQMSTDQGYGYALEGVLDAVELVDFVLANLEGPVTDYPSVSKFSEFGSYENYIFTFDVAVVNVLKEYKFLVSLGNNHVLNFGQDGLDQTIENLEKAGVGYFGQVGRKEVKPYVVYEKNGLKIGIVNYNQFIRDDKQEVFEILETLKVEVDFLVVYTHWGNEYVLKAGKVIQDLAYEFVDKGADLVIGSHPHVIQQVEEYRDKKIYYSLGNFVFDQYFEEETMKGLLVRVDIEKEEEKEVVVRYTNLPINLLPNGQTVLPQY